MKNVFEFLKNNVEEIIQVICGLVSLVCVGSLFFIPMYEKIGMMNCCVLGGGILVLVLGVMYLGNLIIEY